MIILLLATPRKNPRISAARTQGRHLSLLHDMEYAVVAQSAITQ